MVQIRVVNETPIMINNKLRRNGNVLNITESTYKRVLEQYPDSIVLTTQSKTVRIQEITTPPVIDDDVIESEPLELEFEIDNEEIPQKKKRGRKAAE